MAAVVIKRSGASPCHFDVLRLMLSGLSFSLSLFANAYSSFGIVFLKFAALQSMKNAPQGRFFFTKCRELSGTYAKSLHTPCRSVQFFFNTLNLCEIAENQSLAAENKKLTNLQTDKHTKCTSPIVFSTRRLQKNN
jgi:hypothetical protein